MRLQNRSTRCELEDKSKGKKLKSVLKDKKVSQKELSQLTGLTEKCISNLCKGTTIGYMATWIKIARVLNIPIEELLEL